VARLDESNMTHKDYDRYKREISPGCSKTDFQHFLHKKTSEIQHYDSNIGHGLTHHYKVLAYKEKELNKRASALDAFL